MVPCAWSWVGLMSTRRRMVLVPVGLALAFLWQSGNVPKEVARFEADLGIHVGQEY